MIGLGLSGKNRRIEAHAGIWKEASDGGTVGSIDSGELPNPIAF
jgi:hypothetical protein